MTDTAAPPDAVEPAGTPDPVPAARRTKTIRNVAIAVGLVAVVLFAVLVRADGTVEAPSPLLGKPAPPAAGPQVWPAGGSTTADVSTFAGKWVVVNFFATWCEPCREEHDDLVRFANRHRVAGDAVVVSVLYDDPDHAAVRRFFAEHGGEWPVFDDRNAKVDWGVRGVPESFLVSPDGFVLSRIVGGVQIEELEDLLRRAKAGTAR